MARRKSEFLSALGTMFAITKAVTDEVLAQGGNDEDLRRILNDRDRRQAIARLIVGHSEIQPVTRTFPTWRMVTLGLYKTADEHRKALEQAGFKISDYAAYILGKPVFTAAEKETEIDLVHVTISGLGFNNSARFDEICARAKEQGLELCPAEVGPALRLQYPDLPRGGRIIVAMEPITGSGGYPEVFRVEHDGVGQWLGTCYVYPDNVFNPGDRFVFRPRK